MGRFDGKVAVVTGGARGQGRSHALALSAEGARVAVWDIANGSTTRPAFRMASAEDLQETARLIKEAGGECLPIAVDLRWERYRRTEAGGVRGHAGGGAASDDSLTPERLRTITHPMLVLWTDHNPSAAVAEAESAMNYLPNAELKIMKDAGHWPQWEHPEEFDEIVREYLQR